VTSAFPRGPHAYVGSVWNGTTSAEKFDVFAICGAKPPRYKIVRSSATAAVSSMTEILAGAECPAGTSVIGGGVAITDPRPSVNLGDSIAWNRTVWSGVVLATGMGSVSETTSAICAA
jgi:hypothetical protein